MIYNLKLKVRNLVFPKSVQGKWDSSSDRSGTINQQRHSFKGNPPLLEIGRSVKCFSATSVFHLRHLVLLNTEKLRSNSIFIEIDVESQRSYPKPARNDT